MWLLFQSTLPQGERLRSLLRVCCNLDFNPRSHKGSDSFLMAITILNWISIHAPTRGATFIFLTYNSQSKFQSTLPQGERPSYHTILHLIIYFNPRSHKGSDHNGFLYYLVVVISIHAPTRGATLIVCVARYTSTISIHAPTRGATCGNCWHG